MIYQMLSEQEISNDINKRENKFITKFSTTNYKDSSNSNFNWYLNGYVRQENCFSIN